MATLKLKTGGETGGFYWRITGFQSPFDTDTYKKAGITSQSFTEGGTSISGLIDGLTAEVPTGASNTDWQWVDYAPGDYTFYGFAQGKDGRYWSAGDADITVLSEDSYDAPTISVRSVTTNSITVRVKNIDRSAAIICLLLDGEHEWSAEISSLSSTTLDYTYKNLEPGTTYTLEVYVCDEDWSNASRVYDEANATTLEKSAIDPWDWDVSNGSATAPQTQKAYNAVTGKGSCSDFSYKVWNDMCAKMMEYIEAIDSVWITADDTYENTLMSSTDKTLTATRFNALKNNIGSRQSTGIPTVSTGDPVLGEYFVTMMDVLNDMIDEL